MNGKFRNVLAWVKLGARALVHLLDLVDDVSKDVSEVRIKTLPIRTDAEE